MSVPQSKAGSQLHPITYMFILLSAFVGGALVAYYFVYPYVSYLTFILILLLMFFVVLVIGNILFYTLLGKPAVGFRKAKSSIASIIMAFTGLLSFSVITFSVVLPSMEGKPVFMSVSSVLPILLGVLGFVFIIMYFVLSLQQMK